MPIICYNSSIQVFVHFHRHNGYFFLLGARGKVDRALDSRSEGLILNSQCWPCVEVSGKLYTPHCLGPPSCNRYLTHMTKVGSIVVSTIGAYLARGNVKSV